MCTHTRIRTCEKWSMSDCCILLHSAYCLCVAWSAVRYFATCYEVWNALAEPYNGRICMNAMLWRVQKWSRAKEKCRFTGKNVIYTYIHIFTCICKLMCWRPRKMLLGMPGFAIAIGNKYFSQFSKKPKGNIKFKCRKMCFSHTDTCMYIYLSANTHIQVLYASYATTGLVATLMLHFVLALICGGHDVASCHNAPPVSTFIYAHNQYRYMYKYVCCVCLGAAKHA